jgi:hypothetical protein
VLHGEAFFLIREYGRHPLSTPFHTGHSHPFPDLRAKTARRFRQAPCGSRMVRHAVLRAIQRSEYGIADVRLQFAQFVFFHQPRWDALAVL